MSATANVLILGASYGALLGCKLQLARYPVTLVCTERTAERINREGTVVRLPVRGRDAPVEIRSAERQPAVRAATPETIDPADFDLVVLGMQEPQYGMPGVRELMQRIAAAGTPCMAIMNMPPPPYIDRLPGIDASRLSRCFTDLSVWQGFDPGRVTLASPDPQAFRPPEEGKNVLQVSLPTNFKVAAFDNEAHTAMLYEMQRRIDAIEVEHDDGTRTALPVKLKVFDSLYVPLAKWAMLMTGNYRCIGEHDMRSIADAVHGDVEESREVYRWVVELCTRMGADEADMVPFDKYAKAATGLAKPSSAARSLFGGSAAIERVDCLIHSIAGQFDMHSSVIADIVTHVDNRLQANREQAVAATA